MGAEITKGLANRSRALWSLGEALPEARQREVMEAKSGRGDANGVGLVARSTANALAGLAVATGLAVAVGSHSLRTRRTARPRPGKGRP
jgi:hypothetical protein